MNRAISLSASGQKSDEDRSSPLMSTRGGVVRAAILLGFFFAASLTLAWMLALPWGFGLKLERATGCSLVAEKLYCNPFGFEIRFQDGLLENREEFGQGRPMMNIRSFEAKAKLSTLASNQILVEGVTLDLSRLALIIDENGVLNLDRFFGDLFGENKGLGGGMKLTGCRLKIDTVEILDYSKPVPSHKALRLGVDVEDFEAMGAVGLFEPLFEILIRAKYLPEDFSRMKPSQTIAYNQLGANALDWR